MMFGRCRFVLAMVPVSRKSSVGQSPDIQAESSSGKPRRSPNSHPLPSDAERGERAVAGMLGIWTVSPQPPEQIRSSVPEAPAAENSLILTRRYVSAGGLNVGNDRYSPRRSQPPW
jgi:hypothetical protein